MSAKVVFNQSSGTPTVQSRGSIFPAVDVDNAGVTSFKLLDDMIVHGHLNLIDGKFDQDGFNVSAFQFTNSIGANYENGGGTLTILDQSVNFNGTDEYAHKDLDTITQILTQGTGDLSIGVWFKSASITGSVQWMWGAQRNFTGTPNPFRFSLNLTTTGEVVGHIADTSNSPAQAVVTSDEIIGGTNEWTLAELVRRSGTLYLYIKGVRQVDTEVATHNLAVNATTDTQFSLFWGARNETGTADRFFDGDMTRPFYVDGTVTDDDAMTHFNGGDPMLTADIDNVVAGYDINDITAFPTIPDNINSIDMAFVNGIECENRVAEFPSPSMLVSGNILNKIITDNIMGRIITKRF